MPRPQLIQIKPNYPFLLNRKSAQAQGLIGWWPGDGSGGVIHDLSGRQNHGRLTNFAVPYTRTSGWVPGPGNSALVFDGTDDKVDVGTPAFGALTSLSYGCWVRPSNLSALEQPQIITRFGNNSSFDSTDAFAFHINGTTNYRTLLAGPNVVLTSATAPANNTLVHAMVVYDGSTIKIYINGKEDASTAASGTVNAAATTTLLFGYSQDPTFADFFEGTIEDVRFYNRALTPKEVAEIYRNPWDLRFQEIKRSHFIAVPNIGSVTGAVTFSESVAKVGDFVRSPTDAPTISEVVTSGKSIIRSTSDSPTFSETITVLQGPSRTATDAPVISESLSTTKILFKSLSSTLTISQSNTVSQPVQLVEQGLVLSQTVVHSGEFSTGLSNTLTGLLQVAEYFQFKPIAVSNSLTITQTADEVQTTGLVSTLSISQSATYQYDPHLDQQFAVLVPTQTVTVAAIFNRTVSQPVTLVQTVTPLKIITRDVTSTLGVYHTALGGPLRNVSNTLVLSQAVAQETFRSPVVATQQLQVTQSVGLQMILNRSLTTTLVFNNEHPIANGAGGFLQVPNLILTKGGSGSVECCPVSRVSTVFQSSSRAIVLPNPELNDSEGLVAAVSIKRTITGQTYSYVKKSANRKLKYRFLINQRKAYELRQFLLDFLGDRITHTNWKGEMWSGYLLTDPAEIISNARGGVCTGDLYEIELEYQGVRVN